MKEWIKKNWRELLIAILTAIIGVLSACGSAWTLEGNQININNKEKCQNDSITHHNDTIDHKIREIS